MGLREKSDKSSNHVSTLQSMTGNVRKVMLKGQTDAEETIETWRRADDKATRHAHDAAADQCTELSDFGVKLRDFESSDQDLLEDEPELEDGESADDTKDSVFSQNGSVGLSRQDSGGSLPVAKATKKTSRTNLSEASADTGIIGDIC